MTKYLDQNGLAYFWTKIKAWLSSHAPVKYFGQNWNVDTNDDYALVVGNGADGNNPKDVFMIEHDGDLVIGGEDSSKSISFRGENTAETMIEFESNSDNSDGNGLILGAEGHVMIGSSGTKTFLKDIVDAYNWTPDEGRFWIGSGKNLYIMTGIDVNPNDPGKFEFGEQNFNLYDSRGIVQRSKLSSLAHLQNDDETFGYIQNYDSNGTLIGWMEVRRKEQNSLTKEGNYRSFIVYNPVSDIRAGIYAHANDDGTVLFELAGPNASKAFRNTLGLGTDGAFPLTIAQGGTGHTGPQWTDVINDVITVESGFTIDNVSAGKWGRFIMMRVAWKRSSAISVSADGNVGDLTIGTLKEYWRPYLRFYSTDGADSVNTVPNYTIETDGKVKVTGFGSKGSAYSIAANTVIIMSLCFMSLN